jgi:hypothetical protein
VAASGASVVGWLENPPGGRPEVTGSEDLLHRPYATRLLVAVSPGPGQPFDAPVIIADRLSPDADGGSFALGIDDAGTVTVAWTGDPPGTAVSPFDARQFVSTLPPGGVPTRQALGDAFGTAQLVVAPNGRALIAVDGAVGERVGATGEFTPLDLGETPQRGSAGLALRADGAAVIAWREDAAAWAVTRAPGRAFGPMQVIIPPPDTGLGGGVLNILSFSSRDDGPARDPSDLDAGAMRAAVGDDGEVVITWLDGHAADAQAPSVMAVHGTLTGGLEAVATLSNPCRVARDSRPVRLTDGRLAVAWTDNATSTSGYGVATAGRVHVALPGDGAGASTSAPAGPAPTVRATIAGPTRLRAYQPLRVRLSCTGAPCDVLAVTRTRQYRDPRFTVDDPGWNGGAASLAAGRSGTITVAPFGPSKEHGARKVRHPVEVLACTTDGTVTQRVRLTPTLTRRAPEPAPVALGARATQRGSTIHVRWHTARPVRAAEFYVTADERRLGSTITVPGRGRTRFSATLHLPSRARVETITISGASIDTGTNRSVKVRVRRR